MLIRLFTKLRAAKIPVTLTEFLAMLEALKAHGHGGIPHGPFGPNPGEADQHDQDKNGNAAAHEG